MKGMHRSTGKAITDHDSFPEHLYQSIHDILSTLIGTRLCRRNYGSLVPHLVDQPCNDFTRLQIMNASDSTRPHRLRQRTTMFSLPLAVSAEETHASRPPNFPACLSNSPRIILVRLMPMIPAAKAAAPSTSPRKSPNQFSRIDKATGLKYCAISAPATIEINPSRIRRGLSSDMR